MIFSGEEITGAVLTQGRFITPERAAQIERITDAQLEQLRIEKAAAAAVKNTVSPQATKSNTGFLVGLGVVAAGTLAVLSGIFSNK